MESASFHDFRIVQELGRGSFGTVYKARWRKDEAQPFLVLKRIDFKPWHQEKHRLAAKKEVQMLSKVRHPNIIRYFGSFTYKGALFICMEFASQGDMHQFIQKRQRKQAYLTEDTLWRFGNQLVSAIAHLHAASIIHRDLKPLNVFLAEGDKVKVGDLGVSKLVEEFDQNHTRVGTPLYLAPEQIKHQGYDFKVDIWALGCLLYLLTALEPPFFGQNLIQLGNDIVRRNPRSLSGTYSNEWRTLVMQLLTKRPQERPDIFTVEATLRGSDPSGASACSGIPAQFPTSVRHPANKRPMSAYVRHSTAKHDEAAAPIHPSQLAGGVPSQPVVKSRVPSQSTSSSSSSCRGSKESVTAGGAGQQGSSGVAAAAAAAAQQNKVPHSVQKVRPLSAPSIRRVPAGGGSSSSSSSHAAAGAAGGAFVSGGGTSGPALSSSSASGPPGSGAGSGGGRGTLQHLQMLANVNKLGVGASNTTNKLETEYLDVDPVDEDQCCAGGPLNMSAEDHRVTEDRGGRGTASHGRGEGTLLAGSSSAGTSASRVGNLHAVCPSGSAVAAGSGAATASASATTTTSHLQSHDYLAGNQQHQQRQNILPSASRPSSGTAAASGSQQVSCSVVHHPREAWGNSSSSTSVSTSRRILSSSGTTIIPKKLSAGFSRGPGVGGGGTAAGAGAASGDPGCTTPSASGGRIVTHHGGVGQLLHDCIAETQPDPPDYSGSGGGATGTTGGTAPGQHIMPRRPRPSTAVEHLERYKVVPAPSSHGAARTEGAFSASTAAPPGGQPSGGAPSAPLAGAQQQDADAASSCSTAAVTHSTLSSSAAAAPARTAFGVGTTLKTGSRITRPWSAMHRPSVQKPLHLFHAQPVLCNEGVLVTTTSTACSGGGCGTTAGSSTSGANATAAAVCGGGGTSTSTAVPILVATTTVAVGKAKKTRISVHDL